MPKKIFSARGKTAAYQLVDKIKQEADEEDEPWITN
jgi:hypothetical protein